MKFLNHFKIFAAALICVLGINKYELAYAESETKAIDNNVPTLDYKNKTNLDDTKKLDKNKSDLSVDEARQFAEDVGNEVISIFADKSQSSEARKAKFRKLLVKDFDIPAIGRFVLGNKWRKLNDTQKAQYLKDFKNSIVETYSAQFNRYDDQKLEVKSASASNRGGVVVISELIQPHGGEPVKIGWQIFRKPGNEIKVYDIIVNGVSMSITQRSEYAAIFSKTNNIQDLLDYMKGDHAVVDPSTLNDDD